MTNLNRPEFKRLSEKTISKIIKRVRTLFCNERNSDVFKNDAIDYQDLFQMIWLTVVEVLNNYPDKEGKELEKLVNIAITRKLNAVLDKAIRTAKKLSYIRVDSLFNQKSPPTYLDEDNLLFHYVDKMCSEQEYRILVKKIIDKMSFSEIGREEHLTKQRIEQIYSKTIAKLKKKFKGVL